MENINKDDSKIEMLGNVTIKKPENGESKDEP